MIRLKRLTLTNWCQFRGSHVLEFPGNLIGVFGPNGAGKSNMIAAIRYLLRGESGNEGTKADDITKGETEGSVRLELVHDGVDVEIVRKLPSGYAKFVKDDVEIVGANKVRQVVLDMLGVDQESMLDSLLVRQGRLTDLMFVEPAVRERRFHRLCGVDSVEAVRTAIVAERSLLPAETEIIDDDKDIAEHLEQAEKNLEACQKEIEHVLSNMPTEEQVKEARRDCDARSMADTIRKQAAEVAASQAKIAEQIADAKKRLDSAEAACKTARSSMEGARASYDMAVKLLRERGEIQERLERRNLLLRQISRDLVDLQAEPPKEPVGASSCRNDLLKLRDELLARRRHMQDVYNAFSSGGTHVCPLCGQDVLDAPDKAYKASVSLQDIDNEIPKVEQELSRLTRLLSDYEISLSDYNRRKMQAKIRVDEAENELRCLGDIREIGEQEIRKAEAIVSAFDSATAEYNRAVADLEASKGNLAALNSVWDSHTTRLNALAVNLSSLGGFPDDARLQHVQKLLEAYDLSCSKLERLRSSLGLLQQAVDREKLRAQRLEVAKHRNKTIREYRTFLDEVADVLHREKLQRSMVQGMRLKLNRLLNQFLQLFTLPFTVTINEDMSMLAHFIGGKVQPAERLSVGQKVALSVSLVFAESQMFCKNVGILVLDEPTAFLDSDNKANIKELFRLVRTATVNTGTQVILVTHEECLQDVVDQVILLGDSS